jgi:membrane-associated phospholipid phosphatase
VKARTTQFAVAIVLVFAAPCSLGAQPAPVPTSLGVTRALEDTRADAAATVGAGQVVSQPAGPAPTPRHTGVKALVKDLVEDVKHLPSTENLFWAGLGGGLALAVHPADDDLNRSLTTSDFAKHFFKPGDILGNLGPLLGSAVVVYASGRIKDQPKVSHVGMDLIQALAVSGGLTQVLKVATHRERPDGSSHNSFPSGHASGTFAFATALERHLGWKGAVPAYTFASYVAISRLPANRHWFSDVVFGSAVGIISGRTVTRHGKEFPVKVTAMQGGGAVIYVRYWQ